MAVVTINVDDFLQKKLDGEIVTAEDWNKLIALFDTINMNATELLDLIKIVNTNKANIANIALGAIPDGSISAEKLETSGNTKQIYLPTEDLAPQPNTVYYVLGVDGYTPQENLTEFARDVVYYTQHTVETTPAISKSEVIANKLISGDKLKDDTLVAALFTDTVLGGLLNDKCTVYDNKTITGSFSGSNSENVTDIDEIHTRTITFEKEHKALLVLGPYCISLFMADADKPDIHIGINYSRSVQRFTVRTVRGPNKAFTTLQGEYDTSSNMVGLYVATNPVGLATSDYVRLINAYYDASTKTLTTRFRRAGTRINRTANEYTYTFGQLIIGL